MYNPNMYPYGYIQQRNVMPMSGQPQTSSSSSSTYQQSEDNMKDTKRKTNHNEAEKRRVKKINDTIDEIRDILAKDNITHKKDKVSVLEASVSYIKQLLINRDRLSCRYGQLQSIIPTQQDKQDDAESINNSSSTQVDYKSVWIYNSIPSIVVNMESGELVKANKQFYKHFCVSSPEMITNMNLFEFAAESDMTLLWSEVSYFSNLKRKTTRSFVATYNRGTAEPLRCLTIMGNITDSMGNFTLLTLSLLPVTSHGIHEHGFNIDMNSANTLLNTYEDPSILNPHHFSFPSPAFTSTLLNTNTTTTTNNNTINNNNNNINNNNNDNNSINNSINSNNSLNNRNQSTSSSNTSTLSNLVEPTAHPDANFDMQPPPMSMTMQAFNSVSDKKFNIPSFPFRENVNRTLNNS